jgi:hypothetical protein
VLVPVARYFIFIPLRLPGQSRPVVEPFHYFRDPFAVSPKASVGPNNEPDSAPGGCHVAAALSPTNTRSPVKPKPFSGV